MSQKRLRGRCDQKLQAAAHGLNWTYAAFWTLHPTLQVLVWGDGFYNGPIKTYKTVGDSKLSAKEFGFQRSQQLHDLYTRLNAGEGTSHSPQDQSSALNPEDLTAAEWFYVVCMSSLFASGAGLPGRAFANAQYVWHCGSGDARVFIRALPAKTAGIQTVVCIPLLDGVLEFGSTDAITEDPELLQRMQSFFVDRSKPSIPNFESSAVFSKDRVENYKKVMEEGTSHGAFKEWRPTLLQRPANSQKMLKTALFTVTHLYTREDNQEDISRMGRASTMFEGLDPRMNRGFRKPWEVGGSHVMAERRRREKLNDRFVSLRAIVPFVTKADKASILGDTIEYVKELQRRVQELETQNTEIKGRQDSGSQKGKDVGDRQQLDTIHIKGQETTVPGGVERGRSFSGGAVVEVTVDQDMSTVRIHCRWRRSLLIDILHNLNDLQFEVVEVQALRSNGMLDATLKAKVRNPPVGAEASSKVQAALQQTVEGLGSDSNML